MNSPIYEAEQKRLYPHRKDCRTVSETKEHIKYLIDNGFITMEVLNKTPMGKLKNEYFLNVNSFEIFDAIQEYQMQLVFNKIEAANISIDEYKEKGKLCGYELNTYTDGGVNQIIFIDFRRTEKDPKNENHFKALFADRINSIDIDEEIEVNRQDKTYRAAFTLKEAVKDFESWKADLVKLSESL